jgi:hypothetical protein
MQRTQLYLRATALTALCGAIWPSSCLAATINLGSATNYGVFGLGLIVHSGAEINQPPPPADVPEPSSIVMRGIGACSALCFAAKFRHRRVAAAKSL